MHKYDLKHRHYRVISGYITHRYSDGVPSLTDMFSKKKSGLKCIVEIIEECFIKEMFVRVWIKSV